MYELLPDADGEDGCERGEERPEVDGEREGVSESHGEHCACDDHDEACDA